MASEGPDRERSAEPGPGSSEVGADEPRSRGGFSARVTLDAVRLIALVGVVALAVVAGAILASQDVDGWIIGLVVGLGAQVLTVIVLFSRRFG